MFSLESLSGRWYLCYACIRCYRAFGHLLLVLIFELRHRFADLSLSSTSGPFLGASVGAFFLIIHFHKPQETSAAMVYTMETPVEAFERLRQALNAPCCIQE